MIKIVNDSMADYIIKFILMAVALVASIILHELAHGYAALANGDKTAKYAGRLSVNPAKHFDVLGIAMLLFVHVGYAKPVPVNPNNFRKKRLGFFTVSIAGVTVNILLSFVFSFFFVLFDSYGFNNVALKCITVLFYYIAFYNLFLCFFNLLPFYPLDGYNVLQSIFGSQNSVIKFLRNYGMMILLALFGLSVIVSWMSLPDWLDLLGMYLNKTSGFIYKAFIRFWSWILRV